MSRQDREPRKLLTILLISIPSIVDSGNANADFNFLYARGFRRRLHIQSKHERISERTIPLELLRRK